ncbi:hypothetical protein [Streptomyces sp. NPDC055287]
MEPGSGAVRVLCAGEGVEEVLPGGEGVQARSAPPGWQSQEVEAELQDGVVELASGVVGEGSARGEAEDRVDGGAEGGRVWAFFVLVGVAEVLAGFQKGGCTRPWRRWTKRLTFTAAS